MEKVESKKRAMEKKKQALNWNQEGSSGSEEDENSPSSFESRMMSTNRRNEEASEGEDADDPDVLSRSRPQRYCYLSVSVTDSGVGMSEYAQRNCFALFGNLRFRKNINQGGMGLGLTAANLICKALNGSLNLIRSEENVGSKFNFTMRVRLGADIRPPDTQSREDDEGSSQSSGDSQEKPASPEAPDNLNELQRNRQTSLCRLERTLMESQQELNMGQQSEEYEDEEEYSGEEEEAEEVAFSEASESPPPNCNDTGPNSRAAGAQAAKGDLRKNGLSLHAQEDASPANEHPENAATTSPPRPGEAAQKGPKIATMKKKFDFKLRKGAQVHSQYVINDVESEGAEAENEDLEEEDSEAEGEEDAESEQEGQEDEDEDEIDSQDVEDDDADDGQDYEDSEMV